MSEESRALGFRLAEAVAAKDRASLLEVLADDVDFRGMTPGRHWESDTAADLVDRVLLGSWFDPDDHVEELVAVDVDEFADRTRVAYRLRVRNDAGPHLVEQQAYLAADAGRITMLRVMCSGFRPIDE